MGKRGTYQRRKEQQNKLSTIWGILCIFFVFFALIYGIAGNGIKLHRIKHDTLHEYTGSYSYQIRKSYGKHRRSYYVFTLGNGDVVTIKKSLCENHDILAEHRELTIQYVPILFADGYTAVSITTSDGEIVIRDIEKSDDQCVNAIWIFSALLFIWVSMHGFLLVLAYLAGDRKRRAPIR